MEVMVKLEKDGISTTLFRSQLDMTGTDAIAISLIMGHNRESDWRR
jgi:hypothetical protein